jgi:hypothetical protein
MDLDLAKNANMKTMFWTRLGMLLCFGLAASILAVSLLFPTPARAIHPGAGTSPQTPTAPALTIKVSQHARLPMIAYPAN